MKLGIGHREDIDGLRAVAILSVVLYHADLLPRGFVGVDIFFVISGYLIAQILFGELRSGRFSIIAFYERRIRRLLPALFVVLVASMLAAACLFHPGQFVEFSRSVLAATFFVSNLFFFRADEDYFDRGALAKPLLHTWSLAVEEQFYIVFPVALWAVHRFLDARKAVVVLVVLMSASLSAAIWGSYYDPNAAFYLPSSRAWELLLGVSVSLVTGRGWVTPMLRELGGALGLALLAWSLLLLQGDWTPLSVLASCAGAALLILAGGQSLVSRWLAFKPLVFIGLVSYSWYLWHWPALVFAMTVKGGRLSPNEAAVVLSLAFALAVASWKWVEQPFRKKVAGHPPRLLLKQAAAAMTGAVAFSTAAIATDGLPMRFDRQALALEALDVSRGWSTCSGGDIHLPLSSDACRYGAHVPPGWAVWGDSQAGALSSGIGAAASRHHQSFELFARPSCPPLLRLHYRDQRKEDEYRCADSNRATLEFLEQNPEIRGVILAGRHLQYLRDTGVTDESGTPMSEDARRKFYEAGLRDTVSTLNRLGRTVVLVYPTPESEDDVPTRLQSMLRLGQRLEDWTLSFDDFLKSQHEVSAMLDSIPDSARLKRVYPHQLLCDNTRCLVYAGGQPLYADKVHLSPPGAAQVSPAFDSVFSPDALGDAFDTP